jgi:hypothetical protein
VEKDFGDDEEEQHVFMVDSDDEEDDAEGFWDPWVPG